MKNAKIILVSAFSLILTIMLIFFFTEKLDNKAFIMDSHTVIMFVWLVAYMFLFIGGAYFLLRKIRVIDSSRSLKIIFISLVSIFILKLIISSVSKGFDIDISCFTAWAEGSGRNLFGFYTPQEWCDYPPLYISILSFCGKLITFGVPKVIAIRLPALLAEIGISIIIYRIASKNFNNIAAIFLSIAFAMNPVVILDTSLWGQMDAVLAFFIVTAIYLSTGEFTFKGKLLNSKQPFPYHLLLSSMFFASAILIKPQALFFLPILIFALIKNKKVLLFILSGLTGIATIFLIIWPFDKVKFEYSTSKIIEIINGINPAFKDVTAFLSNLPFFKDFFWIGDLFLKTAGGYTGITINAANTYFPFGKNWKTDSERILGLDFATFGLILVGIVLILATLFYFKSNHKSIPWFTAIFLNAGIFMAATRMHERYMFTIIALLIIVFIYSKDILTPILGALFTLTIYINVDYVFTRQLVTSILYAPKAGNTWIEDSSGTIIFDSLMNLLGLVVLLALIMGLVFNNYLPIMKPQIVKPLTRTDFKKKKINKKY